MVQCQAQSGSSNEIINKNEETMKQLITDFNSHLATLESLKNNGREADIQEAQNKLLQIQKDALDVNNNYLDEITTLNSEITKRNRETSGMSSNVKQFQIDIESGEKMKNEMTIRVESSKKKKDNIAFYYVLYLTILILLIFGQVLSFVLMDFHY